MTQIVTIERHAASSPCSWLLPVWFAVGAVLAAMAPGHGWHLFSIGALPGVWVAFLLGTDESMMSWLLPTLLGGLPFLWFLGRLLDRLQTDVRLWLAAALAVAAVVGYFLLQGYVDLEAALDHHGGFSPFLICSLQLGSYGATLLLLVVGAGRSSRR